jgi:hypothetical protein
MWLYDLKVLCLNELTGRRLKAMNDGKKRRKKKKEEERKEKK